MDEMRGAGRLRKVGRQQVDQRGGSTRLSKSPGLSMASLPPRCCTSFASLCCLLRWWLVVAMVVLPVVRLRARSWKQAFPHPLSRQPCGHGELLCLLGLHRALPNRSALAQAPSAVRPARTSGGAAERCARLRSRAIERCTAPWRGRASQMKAFITIGSLSVARRVQSVQSSGGLGGGGLRRGHGGGEGARVYACTTNLSASVVFRAASTRPGGTLRGCTGAGRGARAGGGKPRRKLTVARGRIIDTVLEGPERRSPAGPTC